MTQHNRRGGDSTGDKNLAQDGYRILLLEDDDLDRKAICRSLNKSMVSFDCKCVKQLAEAEQLLKLEAFDIVLTDMNLPDSSGFDTVTSLLDLAGQVPIVVLSGTDDDDIALQAVHVGAQDYISKKYIGDAALLHRTLRHAMERHHLKVGLEKTRDRERFLAHYDQCTALPNRLLFIDRLNQAVSYSQRHQSKFSMLFIDLDRFKHVNDSIGHSAGDEVLRTVGERMTSIVRNSDTVARFGGDEFVVLLQNTSDDEGVAVLSKKIIESVNEPIFYSGNQLRVGASIGVACFPRHGHTSEQILKNADMAMYEAKREGRNQVRFFSQSLFEQKKQFFSIEKGLRDALCRPDENFSLHFQPRVELKSGGIFSVEALIRWQSPQLGNIPPNEFIPLAEELGVIDQIDEWVLSAACKKALEWSSVNPKVRIGVNISGSSFNRRNFVSEVVEPILNTHGVSGAALEIEITESVLITDAQRVLAQLHALKELGFNLALDDFGTGFSSLSYLHNFPIDSLKIDGSFICDKHSNDDERALLKAIIMLGQALRMTVVAECVETEEQLAFLRSLNCHEGQGYYWAKPDANWSPEK